MKKIIKENRNLLDDFGLDMLKRNIPFICFLSLLGLFYIANSHSAENKVSRIISLKNEIKELNWEYLSLKSDLVQSSIYSSVQQKLIDQELGLRGKKHVQIVVNEH